VQAPRRLPLVRVSAFSRQGRVGIPWEGLMSDSATTERPAEKGRRVRFGPGPACAQRGGPVRRGDHDRRRGPPGLAEHPLAGHPTAQPLEYVKARPSV
jgi:hypothetical protein